MRDWSDKPPANDKVPPLRIHRTPPRLSFTSWILSSNITGAMTHYANSRTIKCIGEGCPICADHRLPRWYGYFAIYNPKSAARALFEIPDGAYLAFGDYLVKYKSLRGAKFTASRKPDRPNGQVVCQLTPPTNAEIPFPEEPDVFRLLCQIWGLDWQTELAALRPAQAKTDPYTQTSKQQPVTTNKPAKKKKPPTPRTTPADQQFS